MTMILINLQRRNIYDGGDGYEGVVVEGEQFEEELGVEGLHDRNGAVTKADSDGQFAHFIIMDNRGKQQGE